MTIAMIWYGTADADTFIFTDADVVDNVWAGGGNDHIADGRESPATNDFYRGQAGDDTVISLSGNDDLFGGGGNDFLKVKASANDFGGFDVDVRGGDGLDTFRLTNAEGYSIVQDGDTAVITTRQGGTITVQDVEVFEFVL